MNRSNDKSKLRAWTAMATVATVMLSPAANAQRAERSGNEVVETVCASCHAKGLNGAPRIGDKAAWAKRASQGLTALTDHALTGIRNMPAHGGNAALSDIEIERAITYMVGQASALLPLAGALQVQLAQRVVQKGLSVRETERLVQYALRPPKDSLPPRPDRDVLRLQDELADLLGAQVAIRANKRGAGKVLIEFGDLDQLEGILQRLRH